MKRLIAFLLLVCLSASMLTACVETPDVPGDTVPEATSALSEKLTEAPTAEVTEAQTEENTSDDYFDNHHVTIVEADASKVTDLTLLDDGYDIYQLPGSGNGGWRYGPSYIYYGDGRVDAYFASGGDSGEWDRITHRSSADDGKTWSAEKIVVYPLFLLRPRRGIFRRLLLYRLHVDAQRRRLLQQYLRRPLGKSRRPV